MKKLSAYQKLKLRVAELEHDLNEVVLNPDSFDAQVIKSDITFIHEMDKQLFMGERANYTAKGLMHWANVSEDARAENIKSFASKLESRSSDSTNAHKVPSFERYRELKRRIAKDLLLYGEANVTNEEMMFPDPLTLEQLWSFMSSDSHSSSITTIEPLLPETKPIEGVKYALGSLILECIRIAPYCQDCYLKPLCDAGKFSNNYCKILKVGKDKTPYTLGFMRHCSAYIEKDEQVTDKTE